MALVEAWKKDGTKIPYLIPHHFIGHPVLGPDLTSTPPAKPVKNAGSKASTKEKK